MIFSGDLLTRRYLYSSSYPHAHTRIYRHILMYTAMLPVNNSSSYLSKITRVFTNSGFFNFVQQKSMGKYSTASFVFGPLLLDQSGSVGTSRETLVSSVGGASAL